MGPIPPSVRPFPELATTKVLDLYIVSPVQQRAHVGISAGLRRLAGPPDTSIHAAFATLPPHPTPTRNSQNAGSATSGGEWNRHASEQHGSTPSGTG